MTTPTIQQWSNTDYQSLEQALNLIMHKIPNANLVSTLIAQAQLGYDSDNNYPVYFDTTAVRKILSDKDITTNFLTINNSLVPSVQAVVNYVSSISGGGLTIKGNLTKNSSYTQPISFPVAVATSYPTSGFTQTGNGSGSGIINQGDCWIIEGLGNNEETTIGSSNTKTVANYAFMYATINNPGNDGNNWVIFSTTVLDATETQSGIASIATLTQVNTGADNSTIVTPLKLKETTVQTNNGGFPNRYNFGPVNLTANFLDTVNHNLNTTTYEIKCFDSSNNPISLYSKFLDVNNIQIKSISSLTGVYGIIIA